MGSWFDSEAMSLVDIIDEFGEWFTLQPFRAARVNFAPSPDPTRRSYDFRAVFERDAKTVPLGLEETGVSTRHLCVTALICEIPEAHQGDRIVHRVTSETFEITDVRPDGLSGVEIVLTQLGRAK